LEFPLTELIENRDYPGSSHFYFDIGNGNLLASLDFAGLQVGPYAGECPVAASPRGRGIPAGRLVWDLEEAPVLRRGCNNTKLAAGDPFIDVVVWAGASDWS
jgi:hypothetical protein